eukprot:jgi/Mesvir1/1465/Mv14450-RA.1
MAALTCTKRALRSDATVEALQTVDCNTLAGSQPSARLNVAASGPCRMPIEPSMDHARWRVRCAFRQMDTAASVTALLRDVGQGCLNEDAQRWLLDGCLRDPICAAYPPAAPYLQRLLKKMIFDAEAEGQEVIDELYDTYTRALVVPEDSAAWQQDSARASSHAGGLPSAGWCHRKYEYQVPVLSAAIAGSGPDRDERCLGAARDAPGMPGFSVAGAAGRSDPAGGEAVEGSACDPARVCGYLPQFLPNLACHDDSNASSAVGSDQAVGGVVTLRESLNIFEGSTGCCAWDAGFALSELVLSRPDLFRGRSCLELGAGTALVGICLARACEGTGTQICLTDGDASTVANMQANLRINLAGSAEAISCEQLNWEDVTEDYLRTLDVDILLGADLLYDPAVIPHIVRIMQLVLSLRNFAGKLPAVAYIATALRNVATLDEFVKAAEDAGLCVAEVSQVLGIVPGWLHHPTLDRSRIRIHRFVLSE